MTRLVVCIILVLLTVLTVRISLFSFLPLLLPILRPFFGAFAMPGADLGFEHGAAGAEGAHLAEAGDHLDPVPDAHLSHLPHDRADLVELDDEFLDVGRISAAAGGDAATAADVDNVGIAALVFGHGVDHALDLLHGLFRVLAFRNHVPHAGHAADHVLH